MQVSKGDKVNEKASDTFIDIAYHGYEILEGLCISAMDHIRVDLPLDPSQCPDMFERMRRELPECPEREGK